MMNKSIKNINMNKAGISLIILVITIVVAIIITSIIVVGVTSFLNNGKKTAFAIDLKNVQDAVEIYYTDNGVFPTTQDKKSYTLIQLKTLAGTGAIKLEEEVVKNLDVSEAQFFEINMSKITDEAETIGRGEQGEDDIFVVSSKNMNVYYVKGKRIGGDIYFSLSDKLTKGTNIEREDIDTSDMGISVEAQGIKVTKNKKGWTNSLTITVETNMETGETARYLIAGQGPTSNVVPIDSGTTSIPLNTTTIAGNDLTNFNSATNENKTITIEKLKDGNVIARASLNISNLDLEIGEIPTPVIKSYENSNVLDFTNALVVSGENNVKEMRYEYIYRWNKGSAVTISIASPCVVTLNSHGFLLNRPITFTTTGSLPTGIAPETTYYVIPTGNNTFNLSTSIGGNAINTSGSQSGVHSYSTVENYYIPQPSITEEYMKSSSKKQIGTVISIPKDVKSLVVSILDNSGNISNHSAITIADSNLKADIKEYKSGITLKREIIKPSANVINKNEGTVESWVYVTNEMKNDISDKYIFSTYSDEKYTNTIALRYTRDNKWQAIMSRDNSNVEELSVTDTLNEGWHSFTLKWSQTELSLYINGARVATKSNPTLLQNLSPYIYIGKGPKLNLVRNGYVNMGSNTNFSGSTYHTNDFNSSPASLRVANAVTMFSTDYIPIDTFKIYTQRGTFKSIGAGGNSFTYYGIATYDEDKLYINDMMTNHYINTETVLASQLNNGDTIVYLNNAINWKKSTDNSSLRRLGIYNYKDYPAYTYTRNHYLFSDSDPILNTVTLSSPYSGPTVPAGTKVANKYSAFGSFTYSTMSGVNVPNTWQTYSSAITGSSINVNSMRKFRYGTKYIRVLILLNYAQSSSYITLFDDIEFIDNTDVLFEYKLNEVVISNIARSDNDILKRYNQGVLTKDSNVTYMLTEDKNI